MSRADETPLPPSCEIALSVRSHLEQSSDGTSGDDEDDDESTARRRGASGTSSQDGGSMDVDSEAEDPNATEDEVLEVEDIKGTATQVFQRINGATVRREGGASQVRLGSGVRGRRIRPVESACTVPRS